MKRARSSSNRSSRPTPFAIAVAFALGLSAASPAASATVANGPIDPGTLEEGADGLVGVIVKLHDSSLAAYRGGVGNLAATSPAATGVRRLDPGSPSGRAYLAHVQRKIADLEAAVRTRSARARVIQRYDVAFGGVALRVPRSDVAALASLPEVAAIYPDLALHPDMSRTPAFVGANILWKKVGGKTHAGEGVVVGILDTGIWPEHPFFADPDPAGLPYPAPPISLGAGSCDFSGGSNPGQPFACNHKLIGARRFQSGYLAQSGGVLDPDEFTSARDNVGHGTHVAGTTAGNAGVAASVQGTAFGKLSGMAPRAHIVAYKVCGAIPAGTQKATCFASDSVAAIQQAIVDGVDVINYSISGGTQPYGEAVSLAFLDAYEAGIFVAASGGNSGPGANTVEHREPWVTTVAASSKDRRFASTLHVTASGSATLYLAGTTISAGIATPAPVVDAASVGDTLCKQSSADGAFNGKIVVCKIGDIGRVVKGKNVLARGAAGMILYNSSTASLDADENFVPTIRLTDVDGASLVAFLASHSGVQASFAHGANAVAPGDVMAAFSSRGGSGQALGVSKPDVAAPGIQILSGNSAAPATDTTVAGEIFAVMSGTSMASPHVTGAAALLVQRNPSWTPGQIKSALMTTARSGVVKEDGATATTPFDRGSGRIDLTRAFKPGLTFDVPASDFDVQRDALWKVNLPSVYLPTFPGRATVTRTARDVSGLGGEWQVQVEAPSDVAIAAPATIALPPAGDKKLTMTITGAGVPVDQVRHAVVRLVKTGTTEALVLPITLVRKAAPLTVQNTCDASTVAVGATTVCHVTVRDPTMDPHAGKLTVKVPGRLALVAGSVSGGTSTANTVKSDLDFPAGTVTVAPGTAPFGYFDFAGSACTTFPAMPNEWIYFGLNVDPFVWAGRQWTKMAFTSNGYVVPGGGDVNDLTASNVALPSAARPNGLLAPFWTDLDPSRGGETRYCWFNGANSQRWAVFDWRAVANATGTGVNSFQVWVGMNGVEDVTYAYGPSLTPGNATALTVGAETPSGSSGATRYFKTQAGSATGTLPTAGSALRASTSPAPDEVVTFSIRGQTAGSFKICADVTSPLFSGTLRKCFSGKVQ